MKTRRAAAVAACTGWMLVQPLEAAAPYDADLVLHLEASDGVSVSGSNVSAWNDQSGGSNHLLPGGNPELILASTPTGLASIHFDGDDMLERVHSVNPIVGLPSGAANRTMFLVARYTATTAMAGATFGAAADNQAFGLTADPATGKIAVQGRGAGNDFVPSSSPVVVGGGWIVQSARVSQPFSGFFATEIFLNGAQLGGSFIHTYNTGGDRIRIGREIGDAGYATMDVAAVLVYNRALTNTERAEVETYLDDKFLGFATNQEPSVAITSPADRLLVAPGAPVSFDATATDPENGDLSSSVTWTSDLDGSLGTGTGFPLTTLSAGVHTITAEVEDAGGKTAESTVTVVVDGAPPPHAEDLALRLEATGGIADSGGTVTSWRDYSGWNNDVEPTGNPDNSSGTTPTGLPAIHLDGNDQLSRDDAITTIAGLPLGNADRTVFVVANYQAAADFAGFVYGTAASNEAFGLVAAGAGGQLALHGFAAGSNIVSAEPGVGAGWLIQGGLLSSGTATLFRDGAEIGQLVNNYNTTNSRIRIGRSIDAGGYATMDVAAVLVYDRALDAGEREEVDAWLSGKYLNAVPVVTITSPADASTANPGDNLNFSATATDDEDGDLGGSLQWTSSVDGSIGSGASLSTTTLSTGIHTITASVTDSGGATATDQITLEITPGNTFANWLATNGYTSGGFATDSDSNGIADGAEYFYNQNPNVAGDLDHILRIVTVGTEIQLRYTRLTAIDDVTATLMSSPELASWDAAVEGPAGDYEVISETPNGLETDVILRVVGTDRFWRFELIENP